MCMEFAVWIFFIIFFGWLIHAIAHQPRKSNNEQAYDVFAVQQFVSILNVDEHKNVIFIIWYMTDIDELTCSHVILYILLKMHNALRSSDILSSTINSSEQ